MISVASFMRGEPKDFDFDSPKESTHRDFSESMDQYSESRCFHCNYSGCRRKMNLYSDEQLYTSPNDNLSYPCNKGYFANNEMFSTFTPSEYKRPAMELPFHADDD